MDKSEPGQDSKVRWKSLVLKPESAGEKMRTFKDDAKVEVSFKDKEGVTKLRILRVSTAKNKAGEWEYQLKSEDGTTFADGAWFPEGELDIVPD